MKFDFKKGDEMTENKEMTIAELRQSAMDALILFKDVFAVIVDNELIP
jgi:hypothetical protein